MATIIMTIGNYKTTYVLFQFHWSIGIAELPCNVLLEVVGARLLM